MSRAAAIIGLVGALALVGASVLATSRRDLVTAGPVRNVTLPAERVRVEVLNAGGVSGRARAATRELREFGFDVVHYGNADRFDRDSSAVVDRVGRPDLARAVAEALRIRTVTSEPDPNLFVDVTVFLGREWTGWASATVAEDSVPVREPWDPRAWIGR